MDTTTLDQMIGARVTATRDESGISDAALSEVTGIPRATLQRSLRGLRPFRVSELALLGAALDVAYAEWLTAPSPNPVPA